MTEHISDAKTFLRKCLPSGHFAATGRVPSDGYRQRVIPIRDDSAVAARVHVALPSLNASDRKVAEQILAAGSEVATWSILDLARAAGTSPSTVSRACRSLGFANYQALKVAAAKDAGAGEQVRSSDSADSTAIAESDNILLRLADLHTRSIRSIAATIDQAEFGRAVEATKLACRIVLVGVGTSAAPAQDAAHRLLTIGLDAVAPSGLMDPRILISRLDAQDLVIALSYSGSSKETVHLAQQATAGGVPVIAITCFAGSPLTEAASICLVVGGPELSFRLEALSSRIAHLTVLDAIYVSVALQDPNRANAALDAMASSISDLFF